MRQECFPHSYSSQYFRLIAFHLYAPTISLREFPECLEILPTAVDEFVVRGRPIKKPRLAGLLEKSMNLIRRVKRILIVGRDVLCYCSMMLFLEVCRGAGDGMTGSSKVRGDGRPSIRASAVS